MAYVLDRGSELRAEQQMYHTHQWPLKGHISEHIYVYVFYFKKCMFAIGAYGARCSKGVQHIWHVSYNNKSLLNSLNQNTLATLFYCYGSAIAMTVIQVCSFSDDGLSHHYEKNLFKCKWWHFLLYDPPFVVGRECESAWWVDWCVFELLNILYMS